jgi:hypothetical protein
MLCSAGLVFIAPENERAVVLTLSPWHHSDFTVQHCDVL